MSKQDDSVQKNFLGMPSHPSDGMLHWQFDKDDALDIRKAFDALISVNDPMFDAKKKALDVLLYFKHLSTSYDEAYDG